MSRRVRLVTGLSIAAGLMAIGAIAAVWQPWTASAGSDVDQSSGPQTIAAERTTLTSNVLLNGDVGFGDETRLPGRPGVVTALPGVGEEIHVGQALYEVDGRPVIAMRGERPFWRDLRFGMTPGPDVRQLEQSIAELGFGADVTVDETFTSVTRSAVEAWQRSLGMEATGQVGWGDVVAIDADSLRVAAVSVELGDQSGTSPLSYTSTRLRVVVDLTDAQAREIPPGSPVTVRLPDGSELPATISGIHPGGEPTEEGGTTAASGVVEPDDPAALDGAGLQAVKVKLPRAEVADALVVPVTALLATLDGGYAVEVLRAGETVLVDVELGLIADTRVQITGGDLKEGELVVVAQ